MDLQWQCPMYRDIQMLRQAWMPEAAWSRRQCLLHKPWTIIGIAPVYAERPSGSSEDSLTQP